MDIQELLQDETFAEDLEAVQTFEDAAFLLKGKGIEVSADDLRIAIEATKMVN